MRTKIGSLLVLTAILVLATPVSADNGILDLEEEWLVWHMYEVSPEVSLEASPQVNLLETLTPDAEEFGEVDGRTADEISRELHLEQWVIDHPGEEGKVGPGDPLADVFFPY